MTNTPSPLPAIARPLTPTLSVSPQVGEADVISLKDAGVQHLLCNRPDGEDQGQPTADTVAGWATANGLTFHFLPMGPGGLTEAMVAEVAGLIEAGAPVHGYCRSGTRSAVLVSFGRATCGHPLAAIMGDAAQAGYDLLPYSDALASAGATED